MTDVIYFDNAATSWPKPQAMLDAITEYVRVTGGSPGRSGHRMSIEAGRIVYETREAVAALFGVADPSRIAFTENSTEALNIGIAGMLSPGGHAITTGIEHNSVMRPLRCLEAGHAIELTVVPCSPEGELDAGDVRRALRPNTRLVVVVHASNVTGSLLPVADIGAIAREAGVPFLVDASQSAGACPIDVEKMNVDLLAFTGHKSLLGPTGTGGLYVGEGLEPGPLMRGGTGSRSELEVQPEFMPDRLESGTLNALGLAGLGASVRFVLQTGVERILGHERDLVARFMRGAADIPGITIHGPRDPERRLGVVSFTMAGHSPSEVGLALDRTYGIMTRIGLHCSPAAHRTLGTFPDGTVRFGFGWFNTPEEVDRALAALASISGRGVR